MDAYEGMFLSHFKPNDSTMDLPYACYDLIHIGTRYKCLFVVMAVLK